MAVASRMMRWLQWGSAKNKKYEVRLVVRRIEGMPKKSAVAAVEVKWRGPKTVLKSLRRDRVRRSWTREEEIREGGVVVWDEEFLIACTLTALKGDAAAFIPWEIAFTVYSGLSEGTKNKNTVIGEASLNLAEFALTTEGKEIETAVPLSPASVASEFQPTLKLTCCLLELRNVYESAEVVQNHVVPVLSSPPISDAFRSENNKFPLSKPGYRKIGILKALVLCQKPKKTVCQIGYISSENSSHRNISARIKCSSGIESLNDDHEDVKSITGDSSERKSFNYGTLAYANCMTELFTTGMVTKDNEGLIYYSQQNSGTGESHIEEKEMFVSEQLISNTSKRSILSWRLSFRYTKNKEEPLLKKSNAAEGGDDIDFVRRQLSSIERSTSLQACIKQNCNGNSSENCSPAHDFGDDNFVVGRWELKDIISRDGQSKLQTRVFFASIDQRSEQTSGKAACAVLVTIIADWFYANPHVMPIKSQLDQLIREGSSNWRDLCENCSYKDRFHDRHFDIETVLEAKIRHLSLVPAKSFVGFFHPDAGAADDGEEFNFLKEAKSFDEIWDEISHAELETSAADDPHFKAYILKFDETTTISKQRMKATQEEPDIVTSNSEDELICHGKESCKEYIKSFLAAIPIRQLQADLRTRSTTSTLIHQRLQIDFITLKSFKERPVEPV
ncbi:hypothetical protein ZIOFF_017272 [Zingiber officinale]|uniref:C2 NT-type domain-containing protein n=1 Tax=Zingiber officinale TaxID=94328 RepID=A0A8J5H6W5_ZINOF|nr:hypothetical protein ZIOFF_017272 [Zingiber officinale]